MRGQIVIGKLSLEYKQGYPNAERLGGRGDEDRRGRGEEGRMGRRNGRERE